MNVDDQKLPTCVQKYPKRSRVNTGRSRQSDHNMLNTDISLTIANGNAERQINFSFGETVVNKVARNSSK